jgi:hypothetical protein
LTVAWHQAQASPPSLALCSHRRRWQSPRRTSRFGSHPPYISTWNRSIIRITPPGGPPAVAPPGHQHRRGLLRVEQTSVLFRGGMCYSKHSGTLVSCFDAGPCTTIVNVAPCRGGGGCPTLSTLCHCRARGAVEALTATLYLSFLAVLAAIPPPGGVVSTTSSSHPWTAPLAVGSGLSAAPSWGSTWEGDGLLF